MDSQYNHSYDKGFLSNGEKVANFSKIKMAADENQEIDFWQTYLFMLPFINAMTIIRTLGSHPFMKEYAKHIRIKKWYCLALTPIFWLVFWSSLLTPAFWIGYYLYSSHSQTLSQHDSKYNSKQENPPFESLFFLFITFGTFFAWRLFFITFNKKAIVYDGILTGATNGYERNGVEHIDGVREEIKALRATILNLMINGSSANSPEIKALKKRIQELQNGKSSGHKEDKDAQDAQDAQDEDDEDDDEFPLPD